jgi:hypothetical protein
MYLCFLYALRIPVHCSWKGQGDEPSLVDVGISRIYPKDAMADKSCKFGNAFGELFTGSIVLFFFRFSLPLQLHVWMVEAHVVADGILMHA